MTQLNTVIAPMKPMEHYHLSVLCNSGFWHTFPVDIRQMSDHCSVPLTLTIA